MECMRVCPQREERRNSIRNKTKNFPLRYSSQEQTEAMLSQGQVEDTEWVLFSPAKNLIPSIYQVSLLSCWFKKKVERSLKVLWLKEPRTVFSVTDKHQVCLTYCQLGTDTICALFSPYWKREGKPDPLAQFTRLPEADTPPPPMGALLDGWHVGYFKSQSLANTSVSYW